MKCRPLQLEAGACGQPRSACWRRRRRPARPRGPSRRSKRGPTPGKLCKAAQGNNFVCVGTQAASWAQDCCHESSHCSRGVALPPAALAGYGSVHGSHSVAATCATYCLCRACWSSQHAEVRPGAQIPMHEQTCALLQSGQVQHFSTEAWHMSKAAGLCSFVTSANPQGHPNTAWKQSESSGYTHTAQNALHLSTSSVLQAAATGANAKGCHLQARSLHLEHR